MQLWHNNKRLREARRDSSVQHTHAGAGANAQTHTVHCHLALTRRLRCVSVHSGDCWTSFQLNTHSC